MTTRARNFAAARWPLLPAFVALGLGLWGLSRPQLWQDEHATWWAASSSWSELRQLVSGVDAVLAPYYALMHGWIRLFGASAAALRLPSALAMALCALCVTWLGLRLFGARVGLTAGLLFAATPSVSAYAHEARPYALALLACVASTLALLRALDAPERGARWALYAASVVCLAACHLISLCVLAAHASWLLRLRLQRPAHARWVALAWRFCLSAGGALLLVLPLVWLGSRQAGAVSWIRGGWDKYASFPGELFYSTPLAAVVVPLALVGIWRARAQSVLLAVWALFPPLFLIATFDRLHLFLTRYLMFTLPAWTLLGAFGLWEVLRRLRSWARAPALLALVALLVHSHQGLREPLLAGQLDYRSAASKVRRRLEPGDAITFEGPRAGRRHLRLAFQYHFRSPPPALPRDVFVLKSARELGGFVPESCADSAACLPREVSRLWLITTATRGDLFEGMDEERAGLLQSEFEVREVMKAQNVRVALLTRREQATASR